MLGSCMFAFLKKEYHTWCIRAAKNPHPILLSNRQETLTVHAFCSTWEGQESLDLYKKHIYVPGYENRFYLLLSFTVFRVFRWMANLSITHKHTSINSYEGKWFEQTWAFEISSPHKSTHRCNLGLSDRMSFAITLNTWQLYFWENHCLPVASRRPSIPGTHGCPAWPDPHLFFFVWLTTKWTS